MRKVFLGLLIVDLSLVGLFYFWKGEAWFISSQIAFMSSSLIMLASMMSHKNMVRGRLVAELIPDDERDTLDKVEDPYDLYDENIYSDSNDLVAVVKEERENLKKGRRSLWETGKDSKASLSIYRLLAYVLLVLGFFYLNSNNLLELVPYLSFLAIPPVVMVFVLLNFSEK